MTETFRKHPALFLVRKSQDATLKYRYSICTGRRFVPRKGHFAAPLPPPPAILALRREPGVEQDSACSITPTPRVLCVAFMRKEPDLSFEVQLSRCLSAVGPQKRETALVYGYPFSRGRGGLARACAWMMWHQQTSRPPCVLTIGSSAARAERYLVFSNEHPRGSCF